MTRAGSAVTASASKRAGTADRGRIMARGRTAEMRPAAGRGRIRRRSRSVARSGAVADTVLKLAVMLSAGLAPAAAWRHLADHDKGVARGVSAGLERGTAVAAAIEAEVRAGSLHEDDVRAWRDVATAWRVANAVGAPLAESLRAVVTALRNAQRVRDEVRVTLAEPMATARLMGWLPLVAIGLGLALGFDTVSTLFTHPLGLACLVGGVLLAGLARLWSARLARAAAHFEGVPGAECELFAIALSGGTSIERARTVVAEATGAPAIEGETDQALALSSRAGVPAVDLLRATADAQRQAARTAGRVRAAQLGSRLLLPLGVCTLPAFLLLGVGPMLLGVMSTVPVTL